MDGSLTGLLGRLLISLAVVLALIVVTGRVLRRGSGGGRAPATTSAVEVLTRRPLGRSASVAVVRVGNRALVLGVTDTSVRLLADGGTDLLPEPDLSAQPAAPVPPAFAAALAANSSSLLNSLRERTVRR